MRRTSRIVITLYFILLAVNTAQVTPFFEPPDESAHYLYIHNLLESGELPILESRDAVFASKATQRHHPPLYYLAGAALTFWTERSDIEAYLNFSPLGAIGVAKPDNANIFLHNWRSPSGDSATVVWIMRLFSIVLSVGTLWFIYGTGALMFGRRVGSLAMLLAASIPSFIFISASVNNDNLVTFFFSAGLYWTVRAWHRRQITYRDSLLIGLILAGIALSKANGLALFGLVYGVLLIGGIVRRFQRREVLQTISVSALMAILLAGWWYIRNAQLYGDPLAVDRLLTIWGRGVPPTDPQAVASEAEGVWRSFWMVLGQFNVRAPDWFYTYTDAITLLGVIGLVLAWVRNPQRRAAFAVLLAALLLVIAALIGVTRQVNISQGRILFPALGALAVLLVMGWRALIPHPPAPSPPRREGEKKTPHQIVKSPLQALGRGLRGGVRNILIIMILLPLIMIAILTPATILPRAYPRLDVVDTLPDDVQPAGIPAESIELLGYTLRQDTVHPNDLLKLEVYFRGNHPDDLALSVKALHPVTRAVFGGADVYPGMTYTSQLEPDRIYRARVAFRLDTPDEPAPPTSLDMAFGWFVMNREGIVRTLDWGRTGEIGSSLILPGPTFVDERYAPPEPASHVDVQFGDRIGLSGYTLSAQQFAPGETLTVDFLWRYRDAMHTDWTLTAALLSDQNTILVQHDGMIPGYPTSRWRRGPDFVDTRTLTIPADAPPGKYRLYVGWYDTTSGERLPVTGEGGEIRDNLFFIPEAIRVQGR